MYRSRNSQLPNAQEPCRAQAKRTNVGIALVGEPRVMFLDEPTSGLDSFTGGEVMQVIKVDALFLSASFNPRQELLAANVVTLPDAVTYNTASVLVTDALSCPSQHVCCVQSVCRASWWHGTVQGLTAAGITLMASIHSPTSRTFESFDRWVLSLMFAQQWLLHETKSFCTVLLSHAAMGLSSTTQEGGEHEGACTAWVIAALI